MTPPPPAATTRRVPVPMSSEEIADRVISNSMRIAFGRKTIKLDADVLKGNIELAIEQDRDRRSAPDVAELTALREERDNHVPTMWAYEQVCKARDKWEALALAAETALASDRCPLGMDEHPTVCSAGTCRYCHGSFVAWHEAEQQILAAETALAECAGIADQWLDTGYLTLHAGEMTAQEIRSVKAVVTAIASAIRARGGEKAK